MRFCNNCGTELDDSAKFCAKCGNKIAQYGEDGQLIEEQTNDTTQTTDAPKASKKKTYNYSDMFKRWFWFAYITFGLCSVLMIELGFKFVWTGGKSLMIICGIFAILSAMVFLAYGIINKIVSSKESGEEKPKRAQHANILLAVSIIVFVYVFIAGLALFNIF